MFDKPTTIVLGAGASVDVGYPAGPELAERICTKLQNPRSLLRQTIERLGFTGGVVDEFRCRFHDSTLDTIDEFLEQNSDLLELGRVVIAAELTSCENEGGLMATGRNCWYRDLRRIMGKSIDDLRANQLKVITFNYDRSLEHFLFTAFREANGSQPMVERQMQEVMKGFEFVHIHGQLGYLPWQDYSRGRPYSSAATPDQIRESARCLSLPHEQGGNELATRVENIAKYGERIYFLGFGFAPSNMAKLKLMDCRAGTHFAGTAWKLPELQKTELRDRHAVKLYSKGIRELMIGEKLIDEVKS